MARSFNSMLDRLEASFEAQRRFASDASHELRAPLTVAIGLLSVVDDDRAKRERTVRVVTAECRRMARIVEDLRLLACAELPTFLRLEEFGFEELTYELAAKVTGLGPRRWRVDACAKGPVVADRERLTQAVVNLAHNAFEHTAERDTIALGSEIAPDRARLWVRDTGVGVREADRERIFTRFARGPEAHRRYRGAGLGLSIVATIAEAHGGEVTLDDTPGGGATFTITVPRTPPTATERT
jgi:two-component system OmpR family sensor kinase